MDSLLVETDELTFRRLRDDRSLRYAGRTIDPSRRLFVRLDEAYGSTYAGQVSVIVAANLLSRMTPSVTIEVPQLRVHDSLPWAGSELTKLVLDVMHRSDPFGSFEGGPARGKMVLSLGGREPARWYAQGSGWDCFFGSAPPSLPPTDVVNPFGSAMSVILAAAHLFARNLEPAESDFCFNAYDWAPSFLPPGQAHSLPNSELGEIWTVGVGSVGTAALFFTTLWSRDTTLQLFDHDFVKVHNLDRSPIFGWADVGLRKVDAVTNFLKGLGMSTVTGEPYSLHESDIWRNRQNGHPDLLISTANEFDVRYQIESGSPPTQVYATTGASWQVALLRHVPLVDPCSCCVFPPNQPVAGTLCATDTPASSIGDDSASEQVDAALPFLSFAAGLMAAAEIAKLANKDIPTSPNRSFIYTKNGLFRTLAAPLVSQRPGCLCQNRSKEVHRKMIEGSKYARLSTEGWGRLQ